MSTRVPRLQGQSDTGDQVEHQVTGAQMLSWISESLKKRIESRIEFFHSLVLACVAVLVVASVVAGRSPIDVLAVSTLPWFGLATPEWLIEIQEWIQAPERSNLASVAAASAGLLAAAGYRRYGIFQHGSNLTGSWYLLAFAFEALGPWDSIRLFAPGYLLTTTVAVLTGLLVQESRMENVGFDPYFVFSAAIHFVFAPIAGFAQLWDGLTGFFNPTVQRYDFERASSELKSEEGRSD